MRKKALLLAAVLGLSLAGTTIAGETIEITNAWSRATPPGLDRGVGYLDIHNHGDAPVHLTGATTDVATKVGIHRSRETDGQTRMEAVEEGIRIPPGESATLAPMGYHLMLMGLEAPLKAGERIPLTLEFRDHEDVSTSLEVRSPGQDSRGMENSQ
ncbi:hypothetical protein DES49_0617 [Halospina denitrificans]|uniref:Copper(I)-binding protein n=1 Tax=Halospina denitrificans TaxID=332522 RepID=A0A4R7K348_9GAMM|nr:copper chaperone PCu(A)C [Halospina denitrificans]TDT44507.1 hypothetical protein DES49_0617 [Halospina denitrificans]